MSLYPASLPTATSASGDVGDGLAACGAMMIAVRAADLVCPERRPARDDRTAVVVAGTGRIRSGELVAFCKVVVVAPAVTRRDGRVQASGKPCDYARLGVLEERLDEIAGADAIGRAAAAVTLKGQGERRGQAVGDHGVYPPGHAADDPDARGGLRRGDDGPGRRPGRGAVGHAVAGAVRRRCCPAGGRRSARSRWKPCRIWPCRRGPRGRPGLSRPGWLQ